MNPATLNEICDFQFSFFICITTQSFPMTDTNILMEKTPPVDSVIQGLRAFSFLLKVLNSP